MAYRLDVGSARVEQTPTGGLRVHAHVTRTGVLEYRLPDGSIRREYRPADEVFKADSLASLEDAPFTVEHPRGLLTAQSVADHSVGHVRDAKQDGAAVAATVVIQATRGLAAVRSGLREVSCGYACRTDETPGVTPDGEHYDAIQRDIVYNHVSLVPRGRAGASVRLRLDSNNDTSFDTGDFMIRIDGVDYPLDSDADRKAAAAAQSRYAAKMDAAVASEKARADEASKRVGALELAEKTRADAEIAATCTRILGLPGLGPKDVIAKVLPSVKLDGRDEASTKVLFEAAVAHFDATKPADADGLASVRQASAPVTEARKDGAEKVTVESVRKAAQREALMAWTKPLATSKDSK